MTEKYDPFSHLKGLLINYSSEVPTEILHSTSRDNKSKYRAGWWTGVIADAENIIFECQPQGDEVNTACSQIISLTEAVWSRSPDLWDPKQKQMLLRVRRSDVLEAEEIIRRILK